MTCWEPLLVPAHEEKQQHLQLSIRCFITQSRRRGSQLSWKQLKASLLWLLLLYWFKSHRNDSLWSHYHVPRKQTDDAGSKQHQPQVLSLSFTLCFFPCIVAFYFPLNVGSWDYWRQIQTLNVRPMFCQHFGFGIIQSVNNWFNHRLQTLFIQCML